MQRLLRRACHATNLARERGVTLSPQLISLIERCYDAILMEGFAFHDAQPRQSPPRGNAGPCAACAGWSQSAAAPAQHA